MKVRDVVLGSQYVVRPRSAHPVVATALQLVPAGRGSHTVPMVLFDNGVQVPGQAIGPLQAAMPLPHQTGHAHPTARPMATHMSVGLVRAMGLQDGQTILVRVQGSVGIYERKVKFRGFGKGCLLEENPTWSADHQQVDITSTVPRLINRLPLDGMVLSVQPSEGELYGDRRIDREAVRAPN